MGGRGRSALETARPGPIEMITMASGCGGAASRRSFSVVRIGRFVRQWEASRETGLDSAVVFWEDVCAMRWIPASVCVLAVAGALAQDVPAGVVSAFEPGAVWRDDHGVHVNAHGGGILYEQGMYYWYGEHKVAGAAGNYAQVGVHCYSSRDLLNWRDEGIALAVSDDPESPIARGCILERPKVVKCPATGKYVMWFHLELKGKGYSSALSGVAVADGPTGPFRFMRAGRINPGKWPLNLPEEEQRVELSPVMPVLTRSAYREGYDRLAFLRRDWAGGQMARDMTIFVDDDGTAYHIYASEENSTLHIAELTTDYTAHTGRYVRLFPGRFHEAPAICKRGGRYYMVTSGCTGWAPNAARSMVADAMLGEWRELGNPCVGEGAERTFGAQGTFILPVQGRPDTYIFMADAWRPANAIDGRYVWLPLQFTEDGALRLEMCKSWTLDDD